MSFGDDLHPTARRLLAARALRSVGQGALVVDFALYLHALGWRGVAIGGVLSAGSLFGAALTLLVGPASDRLRRRPFLIGYECVVLACALAALLSARRSVLVAAAVLAGFGRGANGAAGPFSPAEQAWLAEVVAPQRRGRVYSLNAALGFFGMACGALLAVLPSAWRHALGPVDAYRPLFALAALAAAANLVLLAVAGERHRHPAPRQGARAGRRERVLRGRENGVLLRLALVNSFNGAAVGLTGPLMAYWFALRFQVGPAAVAPVMAAAFFITGVSSLATGRLSERIGIVRAVVWSRLLGLVLLVVLPLMPVYWLASLVYLLRSAFNRGSAGARQALAVSLVRDERRGLATSVNAVSFQLPRAAGPGIAGYLLDAGQFTLPFYAAALLQGVYLVLYGRLFRRYEPSLPRDVTPPAARARGGGG